MFRLSLSKKILSCCFLSCIVGTSSFAAAPLQRAVAEQDSLIAVEEDQLVHALVQMVQQQRQQRSAMRQDIPEWLRIQLLADAFDPKHAATSGSNNEAQLATRVAQLEQMIQLVLQQQQKNGIALSPELQQALQQQAQTMQQLRMQQAYDQQYLAMLQQSLNQQTAATQQLANQQNRNQRNVPVVVPMPLPVNATRNDSLEYQLRSLRAELQQLQNNGQSLPTNQSGKIGTLHPGLLAAQDGSLHISTTLPNGSNVIDPNLSAATTANIRLVPADFERSVFFSVSSTHLGSDAKARLSETLRFLNDFPQARLVIKGYASPDGNKKFNERLARQRQQAVQHYLLQQGISLERLILSDGGINRADVGAQVARRVDLSLLK